MRGKHALPIATPNANAVEDLAVSDSADEPSFIPKAVPVAASSAINYNSAYCSLLTFRT